MKKWVIYKIVSPSGRMYIGMTSNYKKRMSYYINGGCKSQTRIFASLKKHGAENHIFSIIEELICTEEYAKGKEFFWIRSYMSNLCKWPNGNGLNLTDGGEGTLGYRASDELRKRLSEIHKKNPSRGRLGKKCSEEQKQKLREYNFKNKPRGRKKWTEEQKLARSVVQKGVPNFKLRGRIASEETRIKQSLAKKGKSPPNKGKPMPPHQIELLRKINTGRPSWNKGKSYDHLTENERKLKFGVHNIGNSYNKGKKHSEEQNRKSSEVRIGRPNPALYKPIIQLSLNGEFIAEHESIKSTATATGLSSWSIGDIAKGFRKTAPDKFIFKYKQA